VRRRAAEAELFATTRAEPPVRQTGGLIGLLVAMLRFFTLRQERN